MRQICPYNEGVLVLNNGVVWQVQTGSPHKELVRLPSTAVISSAYGIIVSPDGNTLAILDLKQVFIYDLKSTSLRCKVVLPRAVSGVRFSPDSEFLLVADKAGDGYVVDASAENAPYRIIGHLSMLLDIAMSDDKKYVITCDRDEKIKVSCYPDTFDIKAFCLGHEEFVTYVDFLPHDRNLLVSASGDGTVKIWDYMNGREVYSIGVNEDLDEGLVSSFREIMRADDVKADGVPINYMSCCKRDDETSVLGVTNHNAKHILLYEVKGKNGDLNCTLLDKIDLEDVPSCFAFNNNKLWMCFRSRTVYVEERDLYDLKDDVFRHVVAKSNVSEADGEDGFLTLYKRTFDNLQIYHLRKKQRLENHIG